ncbi:MAG: formate acetyltransferase, partial [Proteobacteria bacterium]|nr:formate acetyltransferase [Pseudomonadota bacterium]
DDGPDFLSGSSNKTKVLWDSCTSLLKQELENNGVLDIDTGTISGINSYPPGFMDKENEVILGLQTDEPLKRGVNPFAGIRMAKIACDKYQRHVSEHIVNIFSKYRRSHNDGVFSAYTEEMRRARRSGVITGLPDAYGRGRLIGDYRRAALYGVNKLIQEKRNDLNNLLDMDMTDENIRLREEVSDQIIVLEELITLGKSYGYDIGIPAKNALEAVQWTYFAFLGSMRETNGAANSLGRVNTFFDIYIERDIKNGLLDEEKAQELIDHFVIKLRLIRHLRTPEYNELFAGDPVWITEALGGMSQDGRHLVTKTTYRFLQTLYNLGSAPEPNLTVLWSPRLPKPFKEFCAYVSMETSS